MEQRRLLIAILLAFLVLTAYQWLVPAPTPQQTAKPVASAAGTSAPSTSTSTAAAPAALPPVETVLADVAERTIAVDNGFVHAVFSNRGATLISWQLTQYRDSAGKPVDLVPHDMPPNTLKPFSLKLDDAAKTARVNGALYRVQAGTPDSVDATTSPAALVFEYEDASGLRVRKQFRFDPSSYIVEFTPSVTDGTQPVNPTIQWGPGLGDVLAIPGGRNVRLAEAIYDVGGQVSRVASSKLAATPRYQGAYEFAGVDTHYFISAAVKPGAAALEFQPLSLPATGSNPPIVREYIGYDIHYAQMPKSTRFFVGPKHFGTLQKADPELVRAIWFGMFSFLAVPLLSVLNWVNGFIGNYGWSIIALTIIINAAMFPLRHKSFVSMRKMQEIQPQVKAIQDRYAKMKVTDPARQKMNTEMMELYRAKGVNPASGCIPMLLTMPVLIAFYELLSESIELRGSPFIFWLKDLSAADPYYVTPILMGISQMVQQRMTPMTGADPVQQKMMMFMPILFTFLFITSPSGLALYWFASNVLVIGQQRLTNYLIGPPVIRSPKTPAERQMKKVGEGKTDAAE
ncbi:MAG: membrane protein insertase YidC [Vicinamibacterales bacterium]|nr:membrane protein insertase YidC [Vicinamibacterales bacterium]